MKNKEIKFIGKGLVIAGKKDRVAVLGDLHLGYGESLWRSGVMIPSSSFKECFEDIKKFFSNVGNVDKVILLGDVKHYFGMILREERNETFELLDFLRIYAKEIVIIKGNHDAVIEPMLKGTGVNLCNYFIWESYAFLHGDKDFLEVHAKEVRCWIVGHVHPAIELSDGVKHEKYKCFIRGACKEKEIIIMPSLFPKSEGIDVLTQNLGLPWSVDIMKCKVYIVNEDKEPLYFGLVKDVKLKMGNAN